MFDTNSDQTIDAKELGPLLQEMDIPLVPSHPSCSRRRGQEKNMTDFLNCVPAIRLLLRTHLIYFLIFLDRQTLVDC